jgi:phosphohistidine swiveling domain-containing protein
MSRYIVSLDSRSAQQQAQAGGKGASLARLHSLGFQVPQGFVVTVAAFQAFLADFGIQVLTQRMDWAEKDLERIRELLLACRLPDQVARPIAQAYQKLGGRVAVRSSMLGEDTDIISFAGQLDTVLNVSGAEECLRAVRRCWASIFNWRLFNYLVEREASSPDAIIGSFSMAVVVQRMVDAKAAGVAFSADPLTGESCVVIEAARGLGDALVQGIVEPDRYVVDARGVLAVADPVQPDAPVLRSEQILHLASEVRNVASLMTDPQDVEWGWDGNAFYLLQSRPITSLAGQRVYSTAMISEMLPGLIKPLVWSVSTTSKLDNVMGRIFTELIGPNDIDFASLAKRFHSRMYADNTMLGQLLEDMGLPANFFEVMSHGERAERKQRPPITPRMLRTMLRLLRFVWCYSRAADQISAFITRHDQYMEPYRHADWSSKDPQSLLPDIDALTDLYSETMWFNFIGPLNMMVRNRLLSQLTERWAPGVASNDLVRGLLGLKSLESNHALQNMGAQAKSLGTQVLALLGEEDDQTIRAVLSRSEDGRTLVRDMDAFLDRYGFLSASGTDLSRTPWVESPTLIWQAIARMAADPGVPTLEDSAQIRDQARMRVQARLNWLQQIVFKRLLASTVTYIRLREQSSFLISEDSFQMRRIFLSLADHLIARGDLEQRDDMFYLTLDEVRELVNGVPEAHGAKERIAKRRAEMAFDAQIELPDTIRGDYVPTRPIAPSEGQEYLVGIGGSSGVAQGHAQVVRDPADAPITLTRNDILVVPFTDVSWTPLFPAIGGVVAETGGQLSHSAIVAREYGLPAVVNVKNATRLIKNGQPIVVDGTHGRVYLEQSQPREEDD